ncbi:MAG: flagellar biosynthesis protein FlhF [Eubacteriales bacterium]|nr:flagellar biosynthesis protein FlhF [Eubacteriales bacterium]
MRIKRYVATSLQEAMLKIKKDLGSDAVIIHTRKFRQGGFFGLFGRTMVEVTAAVEDHPFQVRRELMEAAASLLQNGGEGTERWQPPPPLLHNRGQEKVVPPAERNGQEGEKKELNELVEGLQEMKSMMETVLDHIEEVNNLSAYPKAVQRSYRLLLEQEVDEKIAKSLIRQAIKNLPYQEAEDPEKVRQLLSQQILKVLKQPKPITFSPEKKRQVVALVGPTGVGKTTTIAKLAAHFALVERKKVALVTMDTYRIAAVEQIKTYANIIGVPVEVAYNPKEMKGAIARLADKELILIDTPGRSHYNRKQMEEIHQYLEAAVPDDIYLVLSATTRFRDLLETVEAYSSLPMQKLVFTKLDETSCWGVILNVIYKTRKNLSYFTVGQNVPDDIEVADPGKVAARLLEGN